MCLLPTAGSLRGVRHRISHSRVFDSPPHRATGVTVLTPTANLFLAGLLAGAMGWVRVCNVGYGREVEISVADLSSKQVEAKVASLSTA